MTIKTHASSSSRIVADLSLLLAALLWGSSFAAQRAAALSGGVYLYNGVRFLLGALFLLPFLLFSKSDLRHITPRAWLGGGLAGLALFAGSSFQQFGMQYTSAANAGFITGLYVILIPFFMAFIYRKAPRGLVWGASVISVIGMFLLSTGGKFALSVGDAWELMGALMWAAHVLIIDRVTHHLDLPVLAILQSSVCGVLSLLLGIFYEQATLSTLNGIWWAVIWTAIASIALGFTLQAMGQKVAPAADAAIILCLESVFAALFGWIILGEGLTAIQTLGALLMFAAMLVVQISNFSINSNGVKDLSRT